MRGSTRFDAADLEDDVAVLEPLHRAVDDLADPLVVLGEDVLALRLAHLLEDDLLGGLRGDAAQHLGRLGNSISSPSSMLLATSSPYSGRYISRASLMAISVAGVVTSSTTVFSANRSTWPVSVLNRVLRFSPVL